MLVLQYYRTTVVYAVRRWPKGRYAAHRAVNDELHTIFLLAVEQRRIFQEMYRANTKYFVPKYHVSKKQQTIKLATAKFRQLDSPLILSATFQTRLPFSMHNNTTKHCKHSRRSFWQCHSVLQGDSVARGPKLLSIKNYVLEIIGGPR